MKTTSDILIRQKGMLSGILKKENYFRNVTM